MATEKLQKILARAGISSRRKAEELIQLGLVTLNGQQAKLGDRADADKDSIKIEGKLLKLKGVQNFYYAFYKPRQIIPAFSDPEDRPALDTQIHDLKGRIIPLAPLSFNSEGLMFLSNDGELAARLQHPRGIKTVYEIKVKGRFTQEQLRRARRGISKEGQSLRPYQVEVVEVLGQKTIIAIVADAAHSMDVKAFLDELFCLVEKIKRVSFGHIDLKGIQAGEKRNIQKSTLEALFTQPHLADKWIENYFKKHAPKAAVERIVKPGEVIVPQKRPPKETAKASPRAASARPRADSRHPESRGFESTRFDSRRDKTSRSGRRMASDSSSRTPSRESRSSFTPRSSRGPRK